MTNQNKVNHNFQINSIQTSEITTKWNLLSCSVRFQLASHRLTHLDNANIATSYFFLSNGEECNLHKEVAHQQEQQQQKHDKT